MFRSSLIAVLLSFFVTAGWAQSPSRAAIGPAASAGAKPVMKKLTPSYGAAAKQSVPEVGHCRVGVISAIGDQFAVQKFGLTVFETEESEVPTSDWGLDNLVFARVRAATGSDPD